MSQAAHVRKVAKSNRDAIRRQREEAEHRRSVEDAEAASRRNMNDQEKAARLKAGIGGYATGLGPGLAQGAVDFGRDTTNLEVIGARMFLSPFDRAFSAPGESQGDQLGRGALNALTSGIDYAGHPSKWGPDLSAYVQHTVADLNPATGYASTVEDQRRRGYEAGENGGKLLFNLATLTEGAGAAKTLADFGYLARGLNAEANLARGMPLKEAKYFADPNVPGQGSHFIPQRTDFFGAPLPKWLMDSPFNRIMPAPGATKGQAAKAHFIRDNRYNGGRVSARYGGGGWSGPKLGWTKPPAPVRWWLGMPIPTRIAGLAGLAGLASVAPQQKGPR